MEKNCEILMLATHVCKILNDYLYLPDTVQLYFKVFKPGVTIMLKSYF